LLLLEALNGRAMVHLCRQVQELQDTDNIVQGLLCPHKKPTMQLIADHCVKNSAVSWDTGLNIAAVMLSAVEAATWQAESFVHLQCMRCRCLLEHVVVACSSFSQQACAHMLMCIYYRWHSSWSPQS
jgi:hypothetical protein